MSCRSNVRALLLSFGALSATACIGDPENRCLKESKTCACPSILSIQGQEGVDNRLTSNVDVFRAQCEIVDPTDPSATTLVPEPFTDHAAVVSLYNSPPTEMRRISDLGPSITFDRYEISFVLNQCRPNAICPALDQMSFDGPTVTARSGSTTEVRLPLVPLRKKFEYVDRGGSVDAFGSYSANFVLHGSDGEGVVKLEGAVEITLGAFDNCPSMTSL